MAAGDDLNGHSGTRGGTPPIRVRPGVPLREVCALAGLRVADVIKHVFKAHGWMWNPATPLDRFALSEISEAFGITIVFDA